MAAVPCRTTLLSGGRTTMVVDRPVPGRRVRVGDGEVAGAPLGGQQALGSWPWWSGSGWKSTTRLRCARWRRRGQVAERHLVPGWRLARTLRQGREPPAQAWYGGAADIVDDRPPGRRFTRGQGHRRAERRGTSRGLPFSLRATRRIPPYEDCSEDPRMRSSLTRLTIATSGMPTSGHRPPPHDHWPGTSPPSATTTSFYPSARQQLTGG